jgi:hypothetical protein
VSKIQILLEAAMLASEQGQNTVIICPATKLFEYQKLLSEMPDGENTQAVGWIKLVSPFVDEQARVDEMETKYKNLGYSVVFDEAFPLPKVPQ